MGNKEVWLISTNQSILLKLVAKMISNNAWDGALLKHQIPCLVGNRVQLLQNQI